MPLRDAKPYKWSPVGVCDVAQGSAIDSSQIMPGGMISLSNLIPDFTTKSCFVCRPAATQYSNAFAGLSNPGFVSVFYIFGDILYGMITTSLNSGFDQPFAFNLATNTAITVTGITAANVPANANSTYTQDWTPATMALVGSLLIVTHPGFPVGANKIGWFDISTPTAPVWHAGDLTTQPLPAGAPIAVANFNGRAWFLCNPPNAQPVVVFSDVLNATTRTNGNQAITLDDYSQLTALQPLQLQNQLGGIIQSLIIFKGYDGIYQITGDYAATSTNGIPFLTKNLLTNNMGTLATNSLVNIPEGLVFLNHDGLRVVDFYGKISPPIGANGEGVNSQMCYNAAITRVCAAANGRVIRITANNLQAGLTINEYWYDLARKSWTGAHTCRSEFMLPYKDTFVLTTQAANGVYRSDIKQQILPNANSTFVEYGSQLFFSYGTHNLPVAEDMNAYSLNEAYVLGANHSTNTNVVFGNEQYTVISGPTPMPNIGGFLTAGQLPAGQFLMPIPIPQTLSFGRVNIGISGPSGYQIEFGDLWLHLQPAGYMAGTLDTNN